MFLKKIVLTHLLPLVIASVITFKFVNNYSFEYKSIVINAKAISSMNYVDHFYRDDLDRQLAFSLALKNKMPIVLGSSELTSNHLTALPKNFFKNDKLFSLGHAGFQSFAMLTTLASNRVLLPNSKITIILSPGWFEKQYCNGTSLESFLEFCPTNYLYQISNDKDLDVKTKTHIYNYVNTNYDKISRPNSVIRSMSRKTIIKAANFLNGPFNYIDELETKYMTQVDFNLVSQKVILNTLNKTVASPYVLKSRNINWDSLNTVSKNEFKLISNNNSISVENNYYNNWLKNKPKKKMRYVESNANQEFKDFKALVEFLNVNKCNAQFVIMPLNTKAHQNLDVLQPTINEINSLLNQYNFRVLDLFTPNLKNYEDGVLEDIMHPYNIGWYKIDKFILDNYSNGK